MSLTIRDIVLEQREAINQKESKRNVVIGVLVSVNGSVNPPGRPNYVYFLEYNQPESGPPAVVFNDAVAAVDGLPVLVSSTPTPPFKRKVIGVYHDAVVENSQDDLGGFNIPLHAHTHQYPSETGVGRDPVLVYQPALQMLKTVAASGLTVTVNRLTYTYYNQTYFFVGANVDLTSYLPTAGNKKAVLLYLNPATGVIEIAEGTEILATLLIPAPAPTIPANCIPSSYIELESTTATIENTDIVDARSFLSSGGFNFTPRNVGDILLSNDGVTFEAGNPVVDASGNIVVDDDSHIVVTLVP